MGFKTRVCVYTRVHSPPFKKERDTHTRRRLERYIHSTTDTTHTHSSNNNSDNNETYRRPPPSSAHGRPGGCPPFPPRRSPCCRPTDRRRRAWPAPVGVGKVKKGGVWVRRCHWIGCWGGGAWQRCPQPHTGWIRTHAPSSKTNPRIVLFLLFYNKKNYLLARLDRLHHDGAHLLFRHAPPVPEHHHLCVGGMVGGFSGSSVCVRERREVWVVHTHEEGWVFGKQKHAHPPPARSPSPPHKGENH